PPRTSTYPRGLFPSPLHPSRHKPLFWLFTPGFFPFIYAGSGCAIKKISNPGACQVMKYEGEPAEGNVPCSGLITIYIPIHSKPFISMIPSPGPALFAAVTKATCEAFRRAEITLPSDVI